MSNTNWTGENPGGTLWIRPSGIDDSIPTYNDPTLSYNEVTEYYDGYNATTITTEDVKFDLWAGDSVSNSTWTDAN